MNTYVKRISAEKGRGVFAAKDFSIDEVILEDHVVPFGSNMMQYAFSLKPAAMQQFMETMRPLVQYMLAWPKDRSGLAIPAGHSIFLNHSYSPNVKYEKDYDNLLFRVRCIRPITKDEELQFNYTGDPGSKTPLSYPFENMPILP